MRMPQRLALITAAVACLPGAFAAEVPPGTQLHPVQEIVRGNATEPATLDPNKAEGRPESSLALEMFEGLVSPDINGNVVPGVAEKWESLEGGRAWRFTLRSSARWSDGSPVTAHDFEYAFKRMVDPKTASQYAWYLGKASNVKNGTAIVEGKVPPSELGVKALDDRHLLITLEQPVAYLVATLAHGSLMPVPRKVIEKYGDRWTEPGKMVSNGAYKLAERVVNERIVMVRNPMYWNNAKTVIDKVTFLPIVNQSAEYQRYRANGLDMTADGGVPPEQLKQIRREIPNELVTWPQLGTYFYAFNFRKKPFDDVRVRKALSLALQREVIAEKLVGTGETPAYSLTPPNAAGYVPVVHEWQRWTQAQRENEARRLLAEAGFTKTRPLRFELLYNTNENHKKIALAAAWMWRRIGPVEVVLVNQEWKSFLDSRARGEFEVCRYSWVADYNEPSTMLDLFHSKHGSNDSKYNNPRYDAIMEQAKVTSDANDRARLYQDAERILAQDFPLANVYHYSVRRLIKPWVKGYGRDPEGRILTRDLYILAH